MKNRLIAALACIACVLGGCATEAGYKKILDSWVGSDADQLVMQWGPPQSSYTMSNGTKVLQFSSARQFQTGGVTTYQPVTTYNNGNVYSPYGMGNYSGTSTSYVPTTSPVQTWNMQCTTRFEVGTDNKIKSYSYEGNDCVAAE